ncbi:SufB/SufD family protein [Facilibium subflavum]|uniref:SufB/SufD family protein n=1 Tax=Facilibium subflavum TaxID=2219058 RepID=UPI000E6505E7|nr:SufD family Fe-S cluster assembly protein [Facilibium subflavum]
MLNLEKSLQDVFHDIADAMVLRQSLWDDFITQGLPTRKQEHWKYTDLQRLYQKHNIDMVKLTTEKNQADHYLDTLALSHDAYHIVIMDGEIAFDKTPDGVEVKSALLDIAQTRPLHTTILLNQALAISGVEIKVQENIILDKPIQINYVQTKACDHKVINYRNKITLSKASSCVINECFISLSDKDAALNICTDYVLKAHASCTYDMISDPAQMRVLLTNTVNIDLQNNAQFKTFQLSANSALTRYDFIVNLNSEQALFDAQGIYTLSDNAHTDYHFYVNHLASNTTSNVNFRGIVGAQAKATFNAKAYVAPGIHGIKALQNNRNIQLTNTAEINTKPELEIYSDDVICSHGATIGQLDQQALFYLLSRGIPHAKSIELLIEGFAKELIVLLQRSETVVERYLEKFSQAISQLV